MHNNLRVSVTDRCNLRCTYCMPEDVTFLDRGELLSFEEIAHFVAVASTLGIDKVRLTGGEPLMRRDLPVLVAAFAMSGSPPTAFSWPSRRNRSGRRACGASM